MKFTRITQNREFADLKDPWNRLLQDADYKSIFQTWEWQKTWWDVFGEERDLCIVVGSEDNQIVGMAPFAIAHDRTRRAKLFSFSTMHYLCTGKVRGRNVIAEYLDVLVHPGRRKEFVTQLLGWLSSQAEWDEILIESVSSESDLPSIAKEACSRLNLGFEITCDLPSILIKLPDSWRDYLNSADSHLRYRINRGRREFEKLKGRYKIIKYKDELDHAFEDLERLHQHRWESKGEPGAFADNKWRDFHSRFIPIAFQNGWLKMSFLELGDRPVAANYSFAFNKKLHFFQSGMIPHENKHVRLGLILHSYCIEEAIHEGIEEYDFLRVGSSGAAYKDAWGNYARPLFDLRLSRRSIKENLYQLSKSMSRPSGIRATSAHKVFA